MSLNWDITKCERLPRKAEPNENGYHEVTDEFYPVLESAIWGMLGTGVGWELTDENAPNFYARYKITALLNGYTPLTPEQVYSLVGLKTNTSPETDAKWRKRQLDYTTTQFKGSYNRVVAALAEAKEGED